MSDVACFTFNPFQENTYVLYDESRECVIIDPGCSTPEEEQKLARFIGENRLKPVKLINTHCHIDHVFGNHYVKDRFQVPIYMHRGELPVLEAALQYGAMMGVKLTPPPPPDYFLDNDATIGFGNTELSILYTPGHSPASVSFYNATDGYVIAGDVLFQGSIGRTDLPGGSFDVLEDSIRTQLYTLPDSTIVYCGHGPQTTIGQEKRSNPFVSA